jgi:hypothetical protein
MNVVVGTTSFTINAALTYEDGSIVDLNDLGYYAVWIRSGRGRYKGTLTVTTDGTDGRVSFVLDAQDLTLDRGPKVTWQFEIQLPGSQVIWTEADTLTVLPRS